METLETADRTQSVGMLAKTDRLQEKDQEVT
jgi:hypothetical protein